MNVQPERPVDQVASLARTALTDWSALPERDVAAIERRVGRAVETGDEPEIDYAVGCLDSLIETLNPSVQTRPNYARTLRAVGLVLAERMDEFDVIAPDADQASDGPAYRDAASYLDQALDLIDQAIRALEGGDE